MNNGGASRLRPAVIRSAIGADTEALAKLARQVWLDTYATSGITPAMARYVETEFTPERFQHAIDDSAVRLQVACQNAQLIGFAKLQFAVDAVQDRPAAELQILYIASYGLRQGIGTALLHAMQHEAQRGCGSAALWLTVNAQNFAARAFYRKREFVDAGQAWFELDGKAHENRILLGPRYAATVSLDRIDEVDGADVEVSQRSSRDEK